MFSTFVALTLFTVSPFCNDSHWKRQYEEYSVTVYNDEVKKTDISVDIVTPNIKKFFEETNKAIVNRENIEPFIDKILQENDIPVTEKNVNNLPLRKNAFEPMVYQSIRAGNFEAFKELADMSSRYDVDALFVFSMIAVYNRPYEYIKVAQNYFSAEKTGITSLVSVLYCNKIDYLKEITDNTPQHSRLWHGNEFLYVGSLILPFNDVRLIKRHMTERFLFMKIYGINLEKIGRTNPSEKVDALHEKNRKSGIISTVPSYHGFNLDKKIVPTPIFTAISGEVIIDNIYYKGATVEVMKHLIEAGAKITPETLDGKSPYALVEKSCRTPKEKKEVIKYLKSIGVKDFGSKDVKQVKCKTDISEKGVYIYIDDKYSSK